MQGNFVDYLLLKMYDSEICLNNNCGSKEVTIDETKECETCQ